MNSKIHQPVNIGNNSEFSILQLAKLIVKLIGSKSKVVFKNLPVDDPKVRQPDINFAKKALKWHPRVHLEEGLNKTIEYFKRNR